MLLASKKLSEKLLDKTVYLQRSRFPPICLIKKIKET